MDAYPADVEAKMKRLARRLSEKDRRRHAAVEAAKLGHGGVDCIARLLGCDPKTIRQGLHDLEQPEDSAAERVRKKGGDDRRRSRLAPRSTITCAACCRNSPPAIRCVRACSGPISRCEPSRDGSSNWARPPAGEPCAGGFANSKSAGARPARRSRWGILPIAMPSSRRSKSIAKSTGRPGIRSSASTRKRRSCWAISIGEARRSRRKRWRRSTTISPAWGRGSRSRTAFTTWPATRRRFT